MTIYSTFDPSTGESEQFFSVREAKKWMKAHPGSTGSKTKVYANGDWEPCGPIELKGSNATFIANSRQTKPDY